MPKKRRKPRHETIHHPPCHSGPWPRRRGADRPRAGPPARARAERPPIRIGVLTDMVGPYAANTGAGSIAGAQLAVEDFAKAHPDLPVEVVSADLQLKPDVALSIAGKWLDSEGVDVITDVPLSSAAFA